MDARSAPISAVEQQLDEAFAPLWDRPFRSERATAKALHEALLPVTKQYGIEVGAQIFQAAGRFGKRYYVGKAVTDFAAHHVSGATMFYGSSAPLRLYGKDGLKLVANWHAHPGNSSTFSYPGNAAYGGPKSPGDLGGYIDSGMTGYVSLAASNALLMFRTQDYLPVAPLQFNYEHAKSYICSVSGTSSQFQSCP